MLAHRFEETRTARRLITAMSAKERADGPLIESDKQDQGPCGQPNERGPEKPHLDSFASRAATWFASFTKASPRPSHSGLFPARGTTTKSIPTGNSPRRIRNASR